MATTTAQPKKASLAHRLWVGEVSYDFIGNRRIWYTFSVLLIAFCIAGLFIRGLNLGIEFSGGSKFTADVQVTESTISDTYDAVNGAGVGDLGSITVTTVGDYRVSVQTRSLEDVADQIKVRQALATLAGIEPDDVAYQQIGASWGRQVTQKGAIALGVFLFLVSALIWLYFRYGKMAISAIVCLLHDLIVTVGVFAWTGFSVTPSTLTGVLTILGYSLYDTVVVFDKVRENWGNLEESKLTYAEAANLADNQVLVRSINTTIIGVLPVAALLFAGIFVLGEGPLGDIGLALFVGMIFGAYSSIFIATPLLSDLKNLEPAVREYSARIQRGRLKQVRRAEAIAKAESTIEVIEIEAAEPAEIAEAEELDAEVVEPAVAAKPAPARQQPHHRSRAQRTGRG